MKKEKLIENINLVIKKATESDALIIFVRDTDVGHGEGAGFQVHNEINIPESCSSDIPFLMKEFQISLVSE